MDRNLLLAIALSLLVVSTWTYWEGRQQAQHAPSPTSQTAPAEPGAPTPSPAAPSRVTGDRKPEAPAATVTPPPATPAPAPAAPARELEIATPLYVARLSSLGASIQSWRLTQYRVSADRSSPSVELVTPAEEGVGALATPFEELGLGNLSEAPFSVEDSSPTDAVFVYRDRGVTVRKHYIFDPASYDITLRLEVRNDSAGAITPAFDVRWPAVVRPGSDFSNESAAAYHAGSMQRVPIASVGSPGLIKKISGSSTIEPVRLEGDIDWAGIDSHYFLAAMIPDQPRDAVGTFSPVVVGHSAEAGISFRPVSVPAGFAAEHVLRVYVGPKEPERLAGMGANLEHAVDVGYSWAAPLTHFFAWLLRACYAVIPNYGIAIILLTVLVRLVTAPLTSRQMRSMKKMGELQPRLKALQEKHKDDRERQSQEMMKLYREAGVNPLGGCLPILLQFPVFIGLYYALQSSIALRQAPFVSWINDLSAPEALFVIPGLALPFRLLPIIMGGSMVLQQRLTPSTMDPAQARMMMTIMPVMFTVMFYQFPSGLVLYWLVSNLLAIGHQAWTNRTAAAVK